MEIVEGQMILLPPAPGVCQECAKDHPAEMPHNAQSLYYQTKFNMEHNRAASWLDAMAHCSPELQAHWTEELERMGVDVAGGKANPS
jgi:hypothetical protein